jgi:hypothetical protein
VYVISVQWRSNVRKYTEDDADMWSHVCSAYLNTLMRQFYVYDFQPFEAEVSVSVLVKG